MVVAPATDPGFAALLAYGQEQYRNALAAQVEGSPSEEYWGRWKVATAAILLASWASGALTSASLAGAPLPVLERVPATFDRQVETLPVPGKSGVEAVSIEFAGTPARSVVERFIRLLPLTRSRWEELIRKAMESAGEMARDEAGSALAKIMERSPDLADLIRGQVRYQAIEPPPKAPAEVRTRRTPAVQGAVQGSFFVTGMTQEQVEATKDLLAKVIRQETTVSVAGKKVESMGVGDFAAHAILQTGTDLTEARLETVYRTNVNRAQTQGRLDICRDDIVRKFAPLMRFRATKDRRTRDTHKQFDGFVATVDQIDAMGVPTPLGFNCRCSWSPIPIARALAEGLCDEDGNPDFDAIRAKNGGRQNLIDKGLVPDPGFMAG